MLRSLAVHPALAALALAGSLGLAHADDIRRTISVTGEAVTSAAPDLAVVTIGVESAGRDARDVLAANSKTTADVITALKSEGIDAKDMQTSGLSVNPVLSQPDSSLSKSDEGPKVTGYNVSNSVTVTLHDLPKLGDLLDKAVTAGANSIDGIQFEVTNQSALLDDARKQAFADARRKAQIYADASAARLGKLVELSENGGAGVRPLYRAQAMKAAVPIETGQNTLSLSVSARFELTD